MCSNKASDLACVLALVNKASLNSFLHNRVEEISWEAEGIVTQCKGGANEK